MNQAAGGGIEAPKVEPCISAAAAIEGPHRIEIEMQTSTQSKPLRYALVTIGLSSHRATLPF